MKWLKRLSIFIIMGLVFDQGLGRMLGLPIKGIVLTLIIRICFVWPKGSI